MRLQVLMSCMNQKDHSIVERANLQTDSIIVNQTDRFQKEIFQHNSSEIIFYNFDEKGVGLSRNSALMRSTADIVLFADDDVVYASGYEAIILEEFQRNPKADMIVFNLPSTNPERPSKMIESRTRVRLHNCLKYSTPRMAVKAESLKEKEIFFSLLFGGGAKYSSGEDSLLIYKAIKNGLRVYAVPKTIGQVSHDSSTWFEGYTEKYFVDKGVLYRALSGRLHMLFSLRFVLKNRKHFSEFFSVREILRFMIIDSKSA